MFSVKEKQHIADTIEKLLLKLDHPEMPREKPKFHLRVDGAESWSFAEIEPNWTYTKDNPSKSNAFNEISRQIHKNIKGIDQNADQE